MAPLLRLDNRRRLLIRVESRVLDDQKGEKILIECPEVLEIAETDFRPTSRNKRRRTNDFDAYDLDSEDEDFLNDRRVSNIDCSIDCDVFEFMMLTFESAASPLSSSAAVKLFPNFAPAAVKLVFGHWSAKKAKNGGKSLSPQVKTNGANDDPYVCFRSIKN